MHWEHTLPFPVLAACMLLFCDSFPPLALDSFLMVVGRSVLHWKTESGKHLELFRDLAFFSVLCKCESPWASGHGLLSSHSRKAAGICLASPLMQPWNISVSSSPDVCSPDTGVTVLVWLGSNIQGPYFMSEVLFCFFHRKWKIPLYFIFLRCCQ